MRYRLSIPKNVILQEEKISNLYEREVMLAKKFARLMIWRKESLKDKVRKLKRLELISRMGKPRDRGLVICETWRRVRKDRGLIERKEGYELYQENFWNMTNEVEVEIGIGEEKKREEIGDREMIAKVRELWS